MPAHVRQVIWLPPKKREILTGLGSACALYPAYAESLSESSIDEDELEMERYMLMCT